jgi:hypothetical protein
MWLQIYRDVGFGRKDGDKANPVGRLLLASLVSAKWRDAILNTHEIWTVITVAPVGTSWFTRYVVRQWTLSNNNAQ